MSNDKNTLANLNEVLSQNPNDIRALANRGETYRLMGDYQRALADFNQVLELEKNHVWALAHRGATYRLMNQLDLALVDLNQVLQLKPDYAWALIYRANVYTLTRRYEEALADVDKALAINENIIPHWPGERALLLSYLRRYDEAIECCEQGFKQMPDDFITLYTLAVVKTRQQGLSQAQADIDKTRIATQAMLDTEERALALYRLGGLAALENDREKALDYLKQAISIHHEPQGLAHHDLAWDEMRDDPHFQSLIKE